jgi:murein DD-endopeptidase MepM/ murein hydrolase activator NlpD
MFSSTVTARFAARWLPSRWPAGQLLVAFALVTAAPTALILADPPSVARPAASTGSSAATTAARAAPAGLAAPMVPALPAAPAGLPWPVSTLAGAPASPRWSWPLLPVPAVLHPFRIGPQPWSPGHRGVDLAGRQGQPVLAPADGVVTFAGLLAGRGVLVLDHPGGLRSSFEPVDGWLPVGSHLVRGRPVAVLGPAAASHCRPSGCLHWGVRRATAYLDPLTLLGLQTPIVLLPLH